MYPTRTELEAAHCWEAEDDVRGRPAMTVFRRRTRLHHARWRERHGHPIGTQPIAPRPGGPVRLVGSRLPLDYALGTGATFVTEAARAAARARFAVVERHQSIDHQRTWADLLWSPAVALNLFGDLADDTDRADEAIHAWWPDAPGAVREVRFLHSPGRFDPEYLNSLRDFDAAFILDLADTGRGVLAVDVKYHEHAKTEIPKPENLRRYVAVAKASGVFRAGAIKSLSGRSELAVMWLEHLLLLSMLQHASGAWTWSRYVVVHAAGNTDELDLLDRYRDLLADDATFGTTTIEEMLAGGALPRETAERLGERYLAE